MKEEVSDKVERKNIVNRDYNDKAVSYYPSVEKRYSLKDQLDQLTGSINTGKLEEVNLVIGIIISAILLAYFIA